MYGMLLQNPTHGHQVTAEESGTRMAGTACQFSVSPSTASTCLNDMLLL